MDNMDPEERGRWERGEEGHWHTLGGMMRRARGMLDDARKAGTGILPPEKLKDKKSLGKMGLDFEPMVVDERQEAPAVSGESAKPEESSSSSSDSSSEDDSDTSDSESEVEDAKDAPAPEFIPIVAGKKRKLGSEAEEDSTSKGVESNPYFMVDTEPTPVEPSTEKRTKKAKKSNDEVVLKKRTQRTSDDEEEPSEKKIKKHKKNQIVQVADSTLTHEEAKPETNQPKVDFTAIERQLQAEVEARMKAKEEEDAAAAQILSTEVSKKDKKRKRTSTGSEAAEKKKVKKEKKRKAAGGDS